MKTKIYGHADSRVGVRQITPIFIGFVIVSAIMQHIIMAALPQNLPSKTRFLTLRQVT